MAKLDRATMTGGVRTDNFHAEVTLSASEQEGSIRLHDNHPAIWFERVELERLRDLLISVLESVPA